MISLYDAQCTINYLISTQLNKYYNYLRNNYEDKYYNICLTVYRGLAVFCFDNDEAIM